jgi:1,2-diacylglycerol 3-beta-galactosyltransferase
MVAHQAAKKVLFLLSHTGGGHLAAARAIRDALYIRYGDKSLDVSFVDVFRDYCLPPFKYAPEVYPAWVNQSAWSWGQSYKALNGPRRAKIAGAFVYWANKSKIKRLPYEHQADVVVSVHSIITRPSMQAFSQRPYRPPFITVVTDLASTPMFWYENRVERCFVPTRAAYEEALRCKLPAEHVIETGLPIHPKFLHPGFDKQLIRQEMGWHPTLPMVQLVSGGDGVGPLEETLQALRGLAQPFQLLVVCGRNDELRRVLHRKYADEHTHIYGFVDMPRYLAASDILITKAGPATISEAFALGVPMIISGAIPGQETGNVEYVVKNKAGEYAPKPDQVANILRRWLDEGPASLLQRSESTRQLARPDAVWQIADAVWQYAHHPIIPTQRQAWV